MFALLSIAFILIFVAVLGLFIILPFYAKLSASGMKRSGHLVQAQVTACQPLHQRDNEGNLLSVRFDTTFAFSHEGQWMTRVQKSDQDYPVGNMVDCYYWPERNRFATADVIHSSNGPLPYVVSLFSLGILFVVIINSIDAFPEAVTIPLSLIVVGGMFLITGIALVIGASRKKRNTDVQYINGIVSSFLKRRDTSDEHLRYHYTPVITYQYAGAERTLVGSVSSSKKGEVGQKVELAMDIATQKVHVVKETRASRNLGLAIILISLLVIVMGVFMAAGISYSWSGNLGAARWIPRL